VSVGVDLAATLVAPWRSLLLLLALPQFVLLFALSRLLHESPQWLLAQVGSRPSYLIHLIHLIYLISTQTLLPFFDLTLRAPMTTTSRKAASH